VDLLKVGFWGIFRRFWLTVQPSGTNDASPMADARPFKLQLLCETRSDKMNLRSWVWKCTARY